MKFYHGTPFYDSYSGILKNGLSFSDKNTPVGGNRNECMMGMVYITLDIINAIRYSFMDKSDEYGYILEFDEDIDSLFPDEDDIGHIINKHLTSGSNNQMINKLIRDESYMLLANVAMGSFMAYSEIGKRILPKLDDKSLNYFRKRSKNFCSDKTIYPVRAYRVKKEENDKIAYSFDDLKPYKDKLTVIFQK